MAKKTTQNELCQEYDIPIEVANQLLGARRHIIPTMQETISANADRTRLDNERKLT